MERKDHIDLFGGSVLVVFSALLGLNQVMIKLVNAGMSPTFQAGLRSLCAFFAVLIFATFMRKTRPLSGIRFLPAFAIGLFFSLEFLLLFRALEYTTVSRASVFFYTMPFWAALGAHFWIPGDRLTWTKTLGMALAIAGVALALSQGDAWTSGNTIVGDVMCLIAAMFWAGILLTARGSSLNRTTPEMQLLIQLAISAVILLPIALLTEPPFREMTAALWGIFSVQVLLVVAVGFLVWLWILSIYPPSSMASYSFLAPVFGVIFGWLILDEHITAHVIGALVMISIGIVLTNRKPAAKKPVHAP